MFWAARVNYPLKNGEDFVRTQRLAKVDKHHQNGTEFCKHIVATRLTI